MEETQILELGKKNNEIFILVKPISFGFTETSGDNIYIQKEINFSSDEIIELANSEHKNMIETLKTNNIRIKLFNQVNPEAKDSVFASDNMLCFKNSDFPDGLCVLCPMYWKSRRLERNPEIVKWIQEKCGYKQILDLTYFEEEDKALEGLGATIFDWKARCVYVSHSLRAHEDVVAELTKQMSLISKQNYEYFMFHSSDPVIKEEVFHTAGLISILRDVVLVHREAIVEPELRKQLIERLEKNYRIIDSTYEEYYNCLTCPIEFQIEGNEKNGLVISESCRVSLREETWKILNEFFSKIVVIDIKTFEVVGGSAIECFFQRVPL